MKRKKQPAGGAFDPTAIEAALEGLLDLIPPSPMNFGPMEDYERKRLWKDIQSAVAKLNVLSIELDLIALPPVIYNPADPSTFAEAIGNKLLLQEPMPLGDLMQRQFYGSGIYALYFHGAFDAYRPIRDTTTPIYVGKADPAKNNAVTVREQGTVLHSRLREHADSIAEVRNLNIKEFTCRYLVVGSGWQIAAEDHLIHLFKPVWNKEMGICQGIGKHGDKSSTRDNRRSAWDTLHPGRPWAADAKDNKRSITQIKADIAEHYQKFPPK